MIDDVLFDMLYDYSFERIFRNYFHFPQKRIVLTVRLKLFTFRYQVSTICYKIFDAHQFEMIDDFHLQMSRKIFVHKIIFVRRTPNILLTKMPHFLYFSYSVFCARLGPYPCVKIKFLKKGDGLLCQILIILHC